MYMLERRSSVSSKESLEDVIIQQYKKNIDKRTHSKAKSTFIPSPYKQKVAPTFSKTSYARPASAKQSLRRRNNSVNKEFKQNEFSQTSETFYSSDFDESSSSSSSSDNELIETNESSESSTQKVRTRPASAQPKRSSFDSYKDHSKPIFKRKPFTITCYASKNGSLEVGVRIAAPTIKQLLEMATLKLGLNTAGRRVFLSNGLEAFRPHDIPKDAEVSISKGEAYIDKYRLLKRTIKSENKFTRTVKPPTIKGLNRLTGKRTYRVVTFQNGKNTESHEVIYDKPSHYTRPESSSKSESSLSMYISEKKKKSISMEIERKRRISFDKFLDNCTERLSLSTQAKMLYNWKGEVISSFDQVEKMDTNSTQSLYYGPIWVSKGEPFDATGSQLYLKAVVSDLRLQLQGAKSGKHDLELMECGDYQSLSNPDILKLDENYIQATKEKVDSDINKFRTLLKKYKSRLKKVDSLMVQQEIGGSNYAMRNIQEIDENSRLLGQHGLRIKMYDNGSDITSREVHLNLRDIQRGTTDKQLIRSRFLEALTSWHKPLDPSGPAKSRFIRRIFKGDGEEISDVMQIENDDEIWVSYGDDFKPWFEGVLTLKIDKVAAVTTDRDHSDQCKVYKEFFKKEDLPENSEKSKNWLISEGFPTRYKFRVLDELSSMEKYEVETALESKSCSSSEHFIQNKENSSFVFLPQVKIDQKETKKMQWPRENQSWIINQNGAIYSRAFPSLSLSVNYDQPIAVEYNDGTRAQGFSVALRKKSSSSEGWCFTAEGQICSSRDMDLVLTYLDLTLIKEIEENHELHGKESRSASDLTPVQDARDKLTIAVLEKFRGQSSKTSNQRWGLKQETSKNGCQWRHTVVGNNLWRKLAYSWPVLPDGQWNSKYKWPMQGCLLPNVPSLLKQRSGAEESSIRLRVFKNGESDKNRFVRIVAPNLCGMEKKQKSNENDTLKQSLIELELSMFLEQATSLLGLNTAARRLFDKNGKELFSLRSLKRDQIVYVSSGDWWIDPRMTKTEGQRRQLLAKLSHDVAMISAFCDLRNPKNLIMEVESGLVVGSRIIIRKCIESRKETVASNHHVDEEDRLSKDDSDDDLPFASNLKSAHEISHLRSDEKYRSKKYSWQQEIENEDLIPEKPAEKRVKKNSKTKKPDSSSFHKFIFDNGFICSAIEPSLVLGVPGIDLENISGVVEVVLCQKTFDDPAQQWNLDEDGFIRMKYSTKLCLAVSMPAYKLGSDQNLTYDGCSVTVQTAKQHTYGLANQKWLYDPTLQAIFSFQSSVMDMEVTAANHVSICTSAVVGPETICQDGYQIDTPSEAPLIVCSACAKMIRGGVQLIKAPEKLAFTCAMANGRKGSLRFKGSFACLNGKVDLSTYEADTTLQHWFSQLDKLKQETSLRLLTREIQSRAPIQACRVLAMRNGEGRLRAPELIIGTSVAGILDQCTQRLSLGTAARRLYTSDGMQVLHMDQLVEWATRNYYEMQKQRQLDLSTSGNDFTRDEPEGNVASTEATMSPEGMKQEEGNNSREGTPDHIAAEADTKLTAADISKKLRPPSGRRSSLNKPPPSQSTTQLQEVPLPVILRTPIEVWVSCGENFIKPAAAEKLYEASLKAQMSRNAQNLILDTEKHTLRHIQGRRYKEMSPRHLKATTMPEAPILVGGGWQETTENEAVKLEEVHRLEEHLAESRPLHPHPKTKGIDLNRDLYAQSNRKRVMVYLKGESPKTAAYVWGESISEILEDASVRLEIHRGAKSLFTESGVRVTSFEMIERDSLLCVTSGDSLRGRPKHSNVTMKANWAKARKEQGPEVTQFSIACETSNLSITNVDPFGPPALSLGSQRPEDSGIITRSGYN